MTPADKLLQKTLVTSGLDSAQWNQVQAGLRDRSFFSSHVESAKFLYAGRTQIAELLEGGKSESEIRYELRKVLDAEGYTAAPGDEGTLKDLRSQKRLDVLIQTNARQARGYVQMLEGTTPGALAAFPGQELIRVRNSQQKRDWASIWTEAGGKIIGGRMVALKSSKVWVRISRFGVPWPPFEFGSGMGVQDLGKAECIELGLVREDDPPQTTQEVPGFNAQLEAEVPFAGTEGPEWAWLKDSFGDQIIQEDGKIKWQAELLKEAKAGDTVQLGKATRALRDKAPELEGEFLILDGDWLKGDAIDQGSLDLLPTIWREPDRVIQGGDGSATLELDTFDGATLQLVLDLATKNPQTLQKGDRN